MYWYYIANSVSDQCADRCIQYFITPNTLDMMLPTSSVSLLVINWIIHQDIVSITASV